MEEAGVSDFFLLQEDKKSMNEEQGWGIPDETRDATDYEPEWIPEPEHEPEPEPPVEEEEINN